MRKNKKPIRAQHEMSFNSVKQSPTIRLQLNQFAKTYPLQQFFEGEVILMPKSELQSIVEEHLFKVKNDNPSLKETSDLYNYLVKSTFKREDMI